VYIFLDLMQVFDSLH